MQLHHLPSSSAKASDSILANNVATKKTNTWQRGTSQVSQASMNLAIEFAFKRVSDEDKLNKLKEEIYRCLINEMMVLCHPAIWSHPNIVELQGICWDILAEENENNTEAESFSSSDNDKIWPVLVFEKAQFGDLYYFAKLPIGRELGISKRLEICLEIGSALARPMGGGQEATGGYHTDQEEDARAPLIPWLVCIS